MSDAEIICIFMGSLMSLIFMTALVADWTSKK